MPLSAHDMVAALPSRVLTPEALDAWLGFTGLPAWLEAQRLAETLKLDAELADWQAGRRRELEAELHEHIDRLRQQAAREQAALVAALRARARTLATDLADAAADSVRQLLQDDERTGGFQALVLRRLLPQLGALPTVAIHVPPVAVRSATALLAEIFPEPSTAVDLVVDDRLARHQCLVRSDDRLFEADLDTWFDDVRTAMGALAQAQGLLAQEPAGLQPADGSGALPGADGVPAPSGRGSTDADDAQAPARPPSTEDAEIAEFAEAADDHAWSAP